MKKFFHSKIAIVTGANRGLGLGLTSELIKLGFGVIMASRNIAALNNAASNLIPENIVCIEVDIESSDSVANFFSKVSEITDHVDVLFNNAGIHLEGNAELSDLDELILLKTLNTNFLGSYRMCKGVIPFFVRQKYGRLINISSGYASLHEMDSNAAAYRISKTSLNALTRVLSSELSKKGDIKVNSACPGWVKTRLGGPDAPLSVEEACKYLVPLALLSDDGPTGKFYRHGIEVPW